MRTLCLLVLVVSVLGCNSSSKEESRDKVNGPDTSHREEASGGDATHEKVAEQPITRRTKLPSIKPRVAAGSAAADATPSIRVEARSDENNTDATLAVQNSVTEASPLMHETALVDPSLEDFDTELLSSAGESILKKLGAVIGGEETIDALEPYLTESFMTKGLRSENLQPQFQPAGVSIYKGELPSGTYAGLEGLEQALGELETPFDGSQFEYKFKTDSVTLDSETQATCGVIYLGMGSGPQGTVQQNARWNVRWDISQGYEHPLLASITITDFEENISPRMVYGDCTEAVFANVSSFDDVRFGNDHLWGRIDSGMGFSLYGDYTVALGDVNNDGLDDLYICQPGGLPNLLLLHNDDHTLSDISEGSGANVFNDTPSALFVDLDNDGHQDLLVGTTLFISMLKGDGSGKFKRVGDIMTESTMSLSSVDYDNDGDLDVYVCRYSKNRGEGSLEPIFDSNSGMPNVLWRNDGQFRFTDVTLESGINHRNAKYSFAAVWEDYDNDGDMDCYVANDFGRNNLYRNDKGYFVDVANFAGVEDRAAGMGASWADYNLDGHMDIYVSNMFSSAGGRIVNQPKIVSKAGEESVSPLQHFARGNTLLANEGDGKFRDLSEHAGITMGRWSWGGEFVDFNNDGLEDIFVPNGFITNSNNKDL